MSAAATAMSVPVPIAMPTWAPASAGASLMPSPTIATVRPRARSSATIARLVLGPHLREHALDAELARDRSRGAVAIAGHHRDLDAHRAAARRSLASLPAVGRSAIATMPASVAVDRDERRRAATRRERIRRGLERGRSRCRPPRATRSCRSGRERPSTAPSTPAPGCIAKSRRHRGDVRPGSSRRRRRRARPGARSAARPRRRARGARARRDPRRRRRRSSVGLPSVSVPVLSSSTVSTRLAASSTAPPLTRMPSSAPRPVPTATAAGVARPSAHGHAITRTATKRSTAMAKPVRGRIDREPRERA